MVGLNQLSGSGLKLPCKNHINLLFDNTGTFLPYDYRKNPSNQNRRSDVEVELDQEDMSAGSAGFSTSIWSSP